MEAADITKLVQKYRSIKTYERRLAKQTGDAAYRKEFDIASDLADVLNERDAYIEKFITLLAGKKLDGESSSRIAKAILASLKLGSPFYKFDMFDI